MAGDGEECCAYLEGMLREGARSPQLAADAVAKLSIALGLVEAALTQKDEAQQRWPDDLPAQVEQHLAALQRFAAEQHEALQAVGDPRAKVKAIADAVWTRLTGAFSKDVLHAQHVASFSSILLPGGMKKNGKRQLDCAGVTTTTLALCSMLALQHGHQDLRPLHLCVSEDHCFLTLQPSAGRAATIEVTTDTPAKRGLPALAELWGGWLYTAGQPVVCSQQKVLAAVVASINPAITAGKKGTDSEHLQGLQARLLVLLHTEFPGAMYPAATCALADLREIEEQDALEEHLEKSAEAALEQRLQRQEGDAQELFEAAIVQAVAGSGPSDGSVANGTAREDAGPAQEPPSNHAGLLWYPYSYMVGFLCRRSDVLDKCAAKFPARSEEFRQRAMAAFTEALRYAAIGGEVLGRYKFHAADDQLYKDVACVLGLCTDGVAEYSKEYVQSAPIDDAALLAPVLSLMDGVCVLFLGKPKPGAWVSIVLRTAKLFTSQARATAAAMATAHSEPMQKARRLWAELKPAVLRPLFETSDVGGSEGRAGKRQRR